MKPGRKARIERLVRLSCMLALVALALIAWALLQPTPVPVIVAMSLGQVIGTLSLLLYVAAIIADLRKAHVLDQVSPASSPDSSSPRPPEPSGRPGAAA